MRERQSASIENRPCNRCLTCYRLTRSGNARYDSLKLFRWKPSPVSKWAHHTQAGLPHEAAKHSKDFSRAFTGPPRRGARLVDQFRCSACSARARRHTSSVNDQSAAPAVSPTSADSPVRAGQRPVDLVLRAISNRWQVHCEIIGNRSIF